MGGVGGRDQRAEHGHAEGAAELAGGVVHGRADAGLAERHRRHDQRGERRHGQRHAGGQGQDRAVGVPDGRVDARAARRARGRRRRSRGRSATTRATPKRFDQLGHLRGERHHHDGHRQLEQAGLERRVAEHQLEVLRHEEERAEHGEEDQRHAAGRHAEAAVAEEAQVEHRVRGVQLPDHEQAEGDDGEAEGGERRGARPAVERAFDDPVDERAEADDRQERRRGCRAAAARGRATSGSRIRPATRARMITGTLTRNTEPHQKCSSRKPEATGRWRRHRRRCRPRWRWPWGARGREDVGEDRQRGGHDEGGGEAHERPGGDDLVEDVGDGGQAGADEEQDEADLQGALAAEAVAEGAGGEEQPGEDEGVGVDHPLQGGGGGVEVAGQAWAGPR